MTPRDERIRRLRRLGLAAVGFWAAALIALMWGPLRDDRAMDEIVVAVALDWRDFGEARARERLQFALDHRGVTSRVADEDCQLTETTDGGRRVACGWIVALGLPGQPPFARVPFGSEARVRPDGRLLH